MREMGDFFAEPGEQSGPLPTRVTMSGSQRRLDIRPGYAGVIEGEDFLEVGRLAGDNDDDVRRRAVGFLKGEVQARIIFYVRMMNALEGLPLGPVHVRDLGARWAEARRNGTLWFHWRLVHAPLPCFHYTLRHALCHLRFPFHCDGFDTMFREMTGGERYDTRWLDDHARFLDPTDGDRL